MPNDEQKIEEQIEEANDNIENENNVFTFTEEEKQRIRDEYIKNVNMINNGISKKENKIKLDLDNLEKRLNDPNEVKVYKLSQQINEKIDKLRKEEKRLVDTYGENKKKFLTRTFRFLLKPGDSEEERTYNDNLYQTYLKNPYKVLQDALKNVMTFNPSGYFNAVQNGDTAKEFEFLNENLDKLELGFTLESEIRDGSDGIDNYGEHNGGAMYSDEFKKLYEIPSQSAFLYGGTLKKISITSTDSYFTVPPVTQINENDINTTGISPNIIAAWSQMQGFDQDDEVIKALKNHPELKVGDNFLINFKAIRTVDGKEEEVALQDAILNDKDVKFIKRPQEEIDILLNPIDKTYLKVVNGEITQEQYDDIELKKFLAEIEDFVRNPSKYHKGEPDFTKPLSDKEKKDIEENYKNNIEKYNKILPDDMKLKLDLEDLRNKMNDPKQAEIYRRTKYIAEKEKKQKALFEKYKSKIDFTSEKYPLTRNLPQLLRIDNSKESSDFNQRFLKLYSKHPFEVGQAVLKGIYKSDASIYNSILKDDYERCKDYCDNYEVSEIAYNEKNISTIMQGDGGLVEEFKNTNQARLIQLKQELNSGFTRPEFIFEIPNMTTDQFEKCFAKLKKEDVEILSEKYAATDIKQTREIITSLKKKGYLDDKEPLLTYKAIETKNGIEKEISLIDAISKNDPNIKIVKRTEEEKEKMLQFSNGIRKREEERLAAKFEIVNKTENVSAKDSLAKHYDTIKKYMDFASNAKNGEERKLENSYDALLGLNCINNAIKYINKNLDTWFDNKEEILKTAKGYGFLVDGNSIKKFESIIGNESLKNIDINFFNKIEEKLTPDEILEFRKEVKGNGRLEFERNNVHVLDKKINEIKNNIPENLSQEEKEKYIKALDNINAKVIRKKEEDFIEKAIDTDSRLIKIEAKNTLSEFVNPLDVSEEDKEVFVERDRKATEGEINFKLENKEHHKVFADVYEKRPHIVIDEKVKNNIKGLAKVVEEAGIFNDSKAGESGQKNYGFTPFFQLQHELKDLINKDTSSYTDEEKKQYREEVIKKSNEMNELEAKYDKVFEYIKKNFDMEKIITNQNIYSGRPPKASVGGLLEKWDNKDARLGVILNGLSQFLGAVKDAGVTVNEFLDDPEKAMRLYIQNKINEVEKPYILPKEGNSLGKRLARATSYDEFSFQLLDNANFGLTRATEFLFANDPDKDRTIQNMQSEALYTKGLQELIHGGSQFLVYDAFNPKPRYDNLVNILMFGDEAKNNIFEPCYEFYNHEFKKTMDLNLMNKYKEMKENPGKALQNIANAVKDFISERAIIDKEGANEDYTVNISPQHVAVAGKIALENMLKVNNMTLDDIKDPVVRENIQAYIKNPVKALGNMFEDNLGLDKKDFELLENQTLEAAEAYNNHKIMNFTEAFSNKMKEIDTSKDDVTMYDVTNEHQIGFFEGFFNTKATRNYRNLIKAINGFENPNSKYYGKPEKVALAAQAYLDHKYKDGKTIDDLNGEAKERAKFCENLIASYKKSFVLEADLFLNKNATDNKEEKIINQEEIIVDKALDNQKEVDNNLENEKEVNVIVANEEPERESVFGLEGDVDIENNKIKKTQSTKTNTKVKVTEKEDVNQNKDLPL